MTKFFSKKDSFLNSNAGAADTRPWRLTLVCTFFLIATFLIICRLIHLQISHTSFLQAQGNARTVRIVDTPSYRGMITDRRGTPLAISSPVHAAWVNPQHFNPEQEQRQQLCALLGISLDALNEKIAQHPNRVFVYLKRGIPPDVAQKIKELNIAGLGLKREFRRYYPTGMQSAQLIGFTDIDDQGQTGLELTFEEQLKPIIGKKRVLEDRTGRIVQEIEQLQTPHSGQDIALSIDVRIQGFAYRELENAVERYGA